MLSQCLEKKDYSKYSAIRHEKYLRLFDMLNYLLILLFFSISAIPDAISLYGMFGFNLGGMFISINELLFATILFLWFFKSCLTKSLSKLAESTFAIGILIFLLQNLVLGSIIGYLNHNALIDIRYDVRGLIWYLGFLVIATEITNIEHIKKLMWATVSGSLVYSFITLISHKDYFIDYYNSERLIFRNDVLLVVSLLIIASALITLNIKVLYKLLLSLLSSLLISKLIVSQWRALLLGLILGLVVTIAVNSFKYKYSTRLISLLLTIVLSILLFSKMYVPKTEFLKHALESFSERIEITRNLKDEQSVAFRAKDIKVAISYFKDSPLIGHGLGASITTSTKESQGLYVDNTIVTLLFKVGLIGTALYLYMIARILYYMMISLKYDENKSSRYIHAAFLALYPTIILISNTEAYMIYYPSILTVLLTVRYFELLIDRNNMHLNRA